MVDKEESRRGKKKGILKTNKNITKPYNKNPNHMAHTKLTRQSLNLNQIGSTTLQHTEMLFFLILMLTYFSCFLMNSWSFALLVQEEKQ